MGEDCTIERWITFWKRRARQRLGAKQPLFQAHSFHHRLRRGENYSERWEYVRMNPVRAGLVQNPDDWPYQGVLNELRW
jgi:putative transposase